ncbi:hypothetical protein Xhom_03763 [Xenorhabdus hominickii]|uniref:Uncharacterized protein n=1 Tax=Xenorhabdus hominickii TaxID=351679 RepID=A0A2G0PYH2_XENHO|nr:hypothetical protein Xhom_04657 [Xenorhabdus hominickii]PHM52968.1 hypothetical protein Xhom_03850 [Xenorhabdus hominickii]PHM53762.1 hypothetical protein Xhom_03763 [Xenorhabdus hominickii]
MEMLIPFIPYFLGCGFGELKTLMSGGNFEPPE